MRLFSTLLLIVALTVSSLSAHADRLSLHSYSDLQLQLHDSVAVATMPWFRNFRLKRKRNKIRKQDISAPTDFKHCYHAVYDRSAEDYSGLPPQWNDLVTTPQKEQLPPISGQDSQLESGSSSSVEKMVCGTLNENKHNQQQQEIFPSNIIKSLKNT